MEFYTSFEYSDPEPAVYSLNVTHEVSALDGVVYNPAIKVINATLPDLENLFNFDSSDPFIDPQDILTFFKSNWRMTFALTFSLFMVIVLPIGGLTWCIIKTCSGSKRRRNNVRGNNDGLLVGVETLLLWMIPILFGAIGVSFYFWSNTALQQGVTAFPDRLESALSDINLYLNQTVKQMDHLTNDNINELESGFDSLMTEAGTNVTNLVGEVKADIDYDKLISYTMSVINDTLEFNDVTTPEIKKLLGVAQISVDEFNTRSVPLKNKITDLVDPPSSFCQTPTQPPEICDNLRTLQNALDHTGLDLNAISLPVVPGGSMTVLGDLKTQINSVDLAMASFSGDIVEDFKPEVKNKLKEIQKEIKEQVEKVTGQLGTIDLNLNDIIPQKVFDISDKVALGLIAPMSIFAIALVFIMIGSILGCIGSPGGKVKSCGSNFFIVSLCIFFMFGSILWILTGIGFFVGAITERGACQTLKDPSGSAMGQELDSYLQSLLQNDLGFDSNITLSKMLESCRGNGTGVYTLFDLKSKFDVDQWVNDFSMEQVSAELRKLVESSFDKIIEETGKIDFTSGEITDITKELETFKSLVGNLANQIPLDKIDESIKLIQSIIESSPSDPLLPQLQGFVDEARSLQNSDELKKLTSSLTGIDTFLNDRLSNDGLFISDLVPKIVDLLKNATTILPNQSKKKVRDVTNIAILSVEGVVSEFIDFGVTKVKEDVGRCGPVANIYDGLLITSLCEEIVNPFNGHWSQLGLGLLFMIPGFFLICSLDGLFKKGKREPRSRYYDEDIYKDMAGYPKARVSLPREEMSLKHIPEHYKGRLNKSNSKY